MIAFPPTAAPRSVGITLDDETIQLLDQLRLDHDTGEMEPRSEIVRRLVRFALHFVRDDDPEFSAFLRRQTTKRRVDLESGKNS